MSMNTPCPCRYHIYLADQEFHSVIRWVTIIRILVLQAKRGAETKFIELALILDSAMVRIPTSLNSHKHSVAWPDRLINSIRIREIEV